MRISILKSLQILRKTSEATFLLLRPWIPMGAALVVLLHTSFWLSSLWTGESDSLLIRIVAIFPVVPYIFLHLIHKEQFKKVLSYSLLFSIFLTGPAFLFTAVFLELNSTDPNETLLLRREFEFMAAFGVFLLASTNIRVALALGSSILALLLLIILSLGTFNWSDIYFSGIPLFSGYIFVYVALIVIARRRSAELDSKSEVSSTIGATIAHELRTPLLSIKAQALGLNRVLPQLIREASEIEDRLRDKKAQQLEQAASSILEEVDSASTLIDIFLLNATNLEPTEAEVEAFDIADAIKEAVERYPYRSQMEQNSVFTDLASAVSIKGPRLLLIHVIFNLLKNSFEHLGRTNTPKIHIQMQLREEEVLIVVRDNGRGIEKRILKQIFDPFFSTDELGSGVGLAFCKDTLEGHFGSTIQCESVVGEFTEFDIRIPLRSI